jgi:hypothetical protein
MENNVLGEIRTSLTPFQAAALVYAKRGLRVSPVDAHKRPLAKWSEDASSDPAAILAMCRDAPYADIAWAIPEGVAVIDIEHNGFADFRWRTGIDAHDFPSATASTPRGGLHLFCETAVPLKNAVRVCGARIDVKTAGGFVVLPALVPPGNGRQWVKRIRPWATTPKWIVSELRRPCGHSLTSRPAPIAPYRGDTAYGTRALERAVAAIGLAPCGNQEWTLNRECFSIGQLIGGGELGERAITCLVEAALAMPAYREPWGDLEVKVRRAVEQGRLRPRTSWSWP